jgi:hypothetical protein
MGNNQAKLPPATIDLENVRNIFGDKKNGERGGFGVGFLGFWCVGMKVLKNHRKKLRRGLKGVPQKMYVRVKRD